MADVNWPCLATADVIQYHLMCIERGRKTMAEIYSIQDLRRMEQEAFLKIPGMDDLLSSDRQTAEKALALYPDAAFALMVSNNLLCGDREQSEMNQRAYLAILRGEDIANVRFRFDREMQAYVSRHMWDN